MGYFCLFVCFCCSNAKSLITHLASNVYFSFMSYIHVLIPPCAVFTTNPIERFVALRFFDGRLYHQRKRKKNVKWNVKCTTGKKRTLLRQMLTFFTRCKFYVFYPHPLICVTCRLWQHYICEHVGLYNISKTKIDLLLVTYDYWVHYI